MYIQRKFVTSLLLLVLLFTEACNKKRPVPPPQAQAPTIAETLPDEIPENPETPVAEAVPPQPLPPQPVKTKPKKQAHPQTAKKTAPPVSVPVAPPPQTPPPAASTNQQVAALHPPHTTPESTPDMAIAAVPSQQVTQQKEDTAHMVEATENALKNLTRSLSEDEKAMRTQIQSYIQQSRKATADGDFERAYNLAKKAQVLAEALIKK
jgi:hypothetical protein